MKRSVCKMMKQFGILGIKNKVLMRTKLNELFNKLKKSYPKIYFEKDEIKFRVLCSVKDLIAICRRQNNCAVIEEYPTEDKTEVSVEWMS